MTDIYNLKNGRALKAGALRKEDNYNVTMRNDLIRAVHRVNVHGKRLLMLAVARLDSRIEYRTKETETTISVDEYAALFGDRNAWRDLKLAADEIFEAQIVFDTTTKTGKKRYKRVRWCSSIEYGEGEAQVVLTFSRAVLPFLTSLNKQFTSYKLENVKALRSVYSFRLYELLMQWKKEGIVEVDIETLHKCLEVPTSYTFDFGQMRRRVLEPAIKELEKSANIEIMWNPKRRGKKVKSVLFGFTEKKQQDLF